MYYLSLSNKSQKSGQYALNAKIRYHALRNPTQSYMYFYIQRNIYVIYKMINYIQNYRFKR